MMRLRGLLPLAMLLSSVTAAGLSPGSPASEAPPAFPGAEGWGAATPGGRGGKVVWVTNLNDSGPGSLRAALETRGPRVILFRVSGVIRLKRPLWLGDPQNPERAAALSFVTVAGHSAPGGGITVADRPLMIGGGVHDIVIRHVRFRNSDADGISLLRGARRVVLDHCSVSWGTDENIGFLGDNQEVTIQDCINAECLHYGGHAEGPHSKGFLISRGANKVSVHHTFISGNVDRNPQFVGNNAPDRYHFGERFPEFDMRNNVIYNCHAQTRLKYGARANIVANYYAYGPRNSGRSPVELLSDEDGSQAYLEGNVLEGRSIEDPWELACVISGRGRLYGKDIPARVKAAAPFAAPPVGIVSAVEAPGRVLAVAGALPRDATDRRLIRELLSGGGRCGAPDRTHASPIPAPAAGSPEPDADGDGMPDAWERERGLDPDDPADGRLDNDGDGFTNLEAYLNQRSERLEREARSWFEGLWKAERVDER